MFADVAIAVPGAGPFTYQLPAELEPQAEPGRRVRVPFGSGQRADVWRLIEAGAVIFVCGNANTMAPAVRSAFMNVFQKQSGKSQADAGRMANRTADGQPLPRRHLGRSPRHAVLSRPPSGRKWLGSARPLDLRSDACRAMSP